MSDCQHGFRKGRSTETATIRFVQHVNDRLDLGEYVVAVFFDLSRAFDTLHPGFVSEKFASLGLEGNINEWICSYLSNRKFTVKVKNKYSKTYSLTCGTPQGSILGPLIFLLYVNDLPSYISEGMVFMYADDTTVVVSDVSPEGVSEA